ncbi:hypothetical protein [Paraburkholderia saeva]|jgi:hypothetical protein|uniref:Oxalate:formate antiporter n=1 Tax=Paraburkholderia saeva TaxID=2777537 RepID=A0A9N8X3E0_9BURK|nr:hypothetical protein [Paraburkholderia saeva]CAG4890148.1 hypothetical protein R70241_00946 [Paraburkholderia saeva]CAG4898028.1 hypothetical protein R52603_02397 [Paraburkholderia saeva]CAG4912095.1 hypothetical protein LMG31841_04133 [Paraburkholderia saeva]
MQLLIVALIAALSFGAMTTYLIAQLLTDDMVEQSARHGRYAYLGEEDSDEDERPARRGRRLAALRPATVSIRADGYASRRTNRRHTLVQARHNR